MKVNIKEDCSIPEGYSYRRCDAYTAAELIAACSMEIGEGMLRPNQQNPYAVEYVRRYPKAEYTLEDKVAIMAMTAQNVPLDAGTRKVRGRKGKRNEQQKR